MKPISVIVPAYNEAGRLGHTLARITDYLRSKGWEFELIVVDDGSEDGTATIAREFSGKDASIRLVRNATNRGKGYSVRAGMRQARHPLRMFCDADLSTPIEELEKLLPWIDRGYDIAIGSRAMPDSRVEIRQSMLRETMGKLFGRIVRGGFGLDVRDSQCGFKLFTAEAAGQIFEAQELDGYVFDVELLLLARRFERSVREVGIRWQNDAGSHVSIWSTPPAILRELAVLLRRFAGTGRSSAGRSGYRSG